MFLDNETAVYHFVSIQQQNRFETKQWYWSAALQVRNYCYSIQFTNFRGSNAVRASCGPFSHDFSGLGGISGVELAFGSCSTGINIHESKNIFVLVTEDIIRLRKPNKSVRATVKPLGGTKKKTLVDDGRIVYLMKRNHLSNMDISQEFSGESRCINIQEQENLDIQKSLSSSGIRLFGQLIPRKTCIRVTGREKDSLLPTEVAGWILRRIEL